MRQRDLEFLPDVNPPDIGDPVPHGDHRVQPGVAVKLVGDLAQRVSGLDCVLGGYRAPVAQPDQHRLVIVVVLDGRCGHPLVERFGAHSPLDVRRDVVVRFFALCDGLRGHQRDPVVHRSMLEPRLVEDLDRPFSVRPAGAVPVGIVDVEIAVVVTHHDDVVTTMNGAFVQPGPHDRGVIDQHQRRAALVDPLSQVGQARVAGFVVAFQVQAVEITRALNLPHVQPALVGDARIPVNLVGGDPLAKRPRHHRQACRAAVVERIPGCLWVLLRYIGNL